MIKMTLNHSLLTWTEKYIIHRVQCNSITMKESNPWNSFGISTGKLQVHVEISVITLQCKEKGYNSKSPNFEVSSPFSVKLTEKLSHNDNNQWIDVNG